MFKESQPFLNNLVLCRKLDWLLEKPYFICSIIWIYWYWIDKKQQNTVIMLKKKKYMLNSLSVIIAALVLTNKLNY